MPLTPLHDVDLGRHCCRATFFSIRVSELVALLLIAMGGDGRRQRGAGIYRENLRAAKYYIKLILY